MERLNRQQFSNFQTLIYRHSGIRLNERKVTLLSTRLQRRLRALSIEDPDDYYRLVTSRRGKDELTQLLDAVTTNETSFFRTESHFQWFRDEFLSEIEAAHRAGQRPPSARIWSAACSNGAEPYSLAFCIDERRHHLPGGNISILATDLSETVLNQAKLGRYKERLMDGVPAKTLRKYFRATPDEPTVYEVKPEFRSMVEFQTHNLMHRIDQPAFDCIFLRNVLIYFDDSSKQAVLRHMVASLADGGYLVIGPSEGIYGLENPLEKLRTFLYRKTSGAVTGKGVSGRPSR